MLGAVIGNYGGSLYGRRGIKGYNLPMSGDGHRCTADTILMTATADALMNGLSFDKAYRKWFARYPDAGFSPAFSRWAKFDDEPPYGSNSNGAAVRAIPIGFFAKSSEQARQLAMESAMVSHDSEEAVTAAQVVAEVIYQTRRQHPCCASRALNKAKYEQHDFDLDELHVSYDPDSSCLQTVPQAISLGLLPCSFEAALRRGLYMGGDTDTQLAIIGSLKQSLGSPLPYNTAGKAMAHLSREGMTDVLHTIMEFEATCNLSPTFKRWQRLDRRYLH